MSDIIRSVGVGRYALALVVLLGSLAVCVGQEQASTQPAAGAQETKEVVPPQGVKANGGAQSAVVPPQEVITAPPAAATPAPASQSPQATPASQPQGTGKAPKKSKTATTSSPGTPTSTDIQKEPYIIGPEDVLFLNVLHQPDVSQTLEVRPDGYVSVRFAGEQLAAGMTTPQLAEAIAEKLTTYFNHPEVNVQVLKINSKKYYISGEVRKAGAYPLTSPKTIYEALIEAGGPADFAHAKRVYVLRGQQKIPFNYTDVSRGKNLQQNILLRNGDVVVVP